jgi:hypothetical protein
MSKKAASYERSSVSRLNRCTFSLINLKESLKSLGPEYSHLAKYFERNPKNGKYAIPLEDIGYPAIMYANTELELVCFLSVEEQEQKKEKAGKVNLRFTFPKNGEYYDKPVINFVASCCDEYQEFSINISDEVYTDIFPLTEQKALELIDSLFSYFGLLIFFSTLDKKGIDNLNLTNFLFKIMEKLNEKYTIQENLRKKTVSIGKK